MLKLNAYRLIMLQLLRSHKVNRYNDVTLSQRDARVRTVSTAALSIECKDVWYTRLYRMLVVNRIDLGLT